MTGVAPKIFNGIMISSTFSDLQEHRKRAITAIQRHGFMPVVMENDGPKFDADVIDSSLQFVRDAKAYVCVISHKYGQTPHCPTRNPDRLSLTELEFNEALALERPILLFLMDEDHEVKKKFVETDPDKAKKLAAFIERATQASNEHEATRIYGTFVSVEDFDKKFRDAIGTQASTINEVVTTTDAAMADEDAPVLFDPPPALVSVPAYFGSHEFVGRQDELALLDQWAGSDRKHPVLLFEAIGGSGKSMLTWEWLTNHATTGDERSGYFWYSFYEDGATMKAFLRAALAYMSEKPEKDFEKLTRRDLGRQLVDILNHKPFVLVLDGIERLLVSYHRIDADRLRDEEADTATDQIGKRDALSCVVPDDDELLKQLTTVRQAKILVSSRLMPKALVNASNTPLPGVRHYKLGGLKPEDAELMIRACGISGDSKTLRAFLQDRCGCHPLVTGVLAGLINAYLPDPGNFDAWLRDPTHGGSLNLGAHDLIQTRNDILEMAIAALTPEALTLLRYLALIHGGADYALLAELNPHRPDLPDELRRPEGPQDGFDWFIADEDQRQKLSDKYEADLAEWQTRMEAWNARPDVSAALDRFDATLSDLVKSGLVQFDRDRKRYDLHPVVRSVVSGRMDKDEAGSVSGRLVDHFTSKPHNPWEQATSLADLEIGLQLTRLHLRNGEYQAAFSVFDGDLSAALGINLGNNAAIQSLLRPFFPNGWAAGPVQLDHDAATSRLLHDAARSLVITDPQSARALTELAIAIETRSGTAWGLGMMVKLALDLEKNAGRLAKALRLAELWNRLAVVEDDSNHVFQAKLDLFALLTELGRDLQAETVWAELDPMGRDWPRYAYRPGEAETARNVLDFRKGHLTDEALDKTLRLAVGGRDVNLQIYSHAARGYWHLRRNEQEEAAGSFARAIALNRGAEREDAGLEAAHLRARLLAGQITADAARTEADELEPYAGSSLSLARVFHHLGETSRAEKLALKNHDWAVADGEPFVRRYELDEVRAFLSEIGAALPEIPQHDPAKDIPEPWEADVEAFIEKLKQEKKQEKAKAKKEAAARRRKAKRTPPPDDASEA